MKFTYEQIKEIENIGNIDNVLMKRFLACQAEFKEQSYYYMLFSIEDLYWLAVNYGFKFHYYEHKSNIEHIKIIVEQYDKKLIERFYFIEHKQIIQRRTKQPTISPENVTFIRFKDAFNIFSMIVNRPNDRI